VCLAGTSLEIRHRDTVKLVRYIAFGSKQASLGQVSLRYVTSLFVFALLAVVYSDRCILESQLLSGASVFRRLFDRFLCFTLRLLIFNLLLFGLNDFLVFRILRRKTQTLGVLSLSHLAYRFSPPSRCLLSRLVFLYSSLSFSSGLLEVEYFGNEVFELLLMALNERLFVLLAWLVV
jgi:hypothetical protein